MHKNCAKIFSQPWVLLSWNFLEIDYEWPGIVYKIFFILFSFHIQFSIFEIIIIQIKWTELFMFFFYPINLLCLLLSFKWISDETPLIIIKVHFLQSFRPRYNWNIVESGIKHHNPNPSKSCHYLYMILWFLAEFVSHSEMISCFYNEMSVWMVYIFLRYLLSYLPVYYDYLSCYLFFYFNPISFYNIYIWHVSIYSYWIMSIKLTGICRHLVGTRYIRSSYLGKAPIK
jgi:hypothetical protein